MPDRWAWVLTGNTWGPLPGGPPRPLARKLSAARNHADIATMTLGLTDRVCVELFAALRSYIPGLEVWRNDDVVFAGHWWPMSGGHIAGQAGTVDLTFKSAFALYEERLTEDPVEQYFAEDAGAIAQQLIERSDFLYGPSPLTSSGTIEETTIRDREYSSVPVGEAIIQLTEVRGGFDWYPTYTDPAATGGRTMTFNIAARYGTDRPGARFEFGAGTLDNCSAYKFATSLPTNIVRALGATGLVREQADEDSQGRFGPYMKALGANDVSETATLDALALDAIRSNPAMVTEITGDPAKCPRPWDDFWIGDTIRVGIDDGGVQEQSEPRVQTIDVSLDDSDNISELVVGFDPAAAGGYLAPANSTRRYVQQQRDLARRVSALER